MCGCICPSCKTPLIAKQGQEKQWHFAHASRSVFNKTEEECKYSFFVSVRLMSRQIIHKSLTLKLPQYIRQVGEYLPEYQYYLSVPCTVTAQRNVEISDIEVEKVFMNSPVDIFGHIGDYSFIIYFTHPGRSVPNEFHNPTDKKIGVISISLEPTYAIFASSKKNRISYQTQLYDFLSNDLESKTWVFHPRQERCEKISKDKLQQKISEFKKNKTNINVQHQRKHNNSETHLHLASRPTIENTEVEEVQRKRAKFKCVLCQTEWEGLEPSDSACPKCGTHLYRKFQGYVE